MDATVATGAAAMMAIRVLLDHDVPEENILVVSLLMAASGVHSIAYTFPQVRIVSSAVDPEINEKFFVKPGIGNFGDRYFGMVLFHWLLYYYHLKSKYKLIDFIKGTEPLEL